MISTVSKITITRPKEWTNRLRSYSLYLDDQKLGTLANDEIKTFEVPPGTHTLRAKVDWCGSREVEFNLAGGEMKYFHLSAFRYSNFIMLLFSVIVILHFLLRRFAGFPYLVWLVIPGFLVLVYYLTVGRNNYLWLRQSDTW